MGHDEQYQTDVFLSRFKLAAGWSCPSRLGTELDSVHSCRLSVLGGRFEANDACSDRRTVLSRI